MLYLVNRNVPTDLHVWAKLNIIAMTSAYYVLFNFWIMLQISVLETVCILIIHIHPLNVSCLGVKSQDRQTQIQIDR